MKFNKIKDIFRYLDNITETALLKFLTLVQFRHRESLAGSLLPVRLQTNKIESLALICYLNEETKMLRLVPEADGQLHLRQTSFVKQQNPTLHVQNSQSKHRQGVKVAQAKALPTQALSSQLSPYHPPVALVLRISRLKSKFVCFDQNLEFHLKHHPPHSRFSVPSSPS